MSKITLALVIIREQLSSGKRFPTPVYFTATTSALKSGITVIKDNSTIEKI